MDLGIDGLGPATEIGSGASAVVYRAGQPGLDREVAVKVLVSTDPQVVRQFEREAKALGRLGRHPGIATVHQSGLTARGHPYLMLECHPTSLADRLKAGPLSPREACRMLAPVVSALRWAHQQGVVHCDLKPANLLFDHHGHLVITDFGVAAIAGATTTTDRSTPVGFTAGYVAPEVVQGRRATTATDVYAVGATLFHMVTASPAYVDPANANLVALAHRVVHLPTPDVQQYGVPPDVAAIIERTMAKDPALRPTTERLTQLLVDAGRDPDPDRTVIMPPDGLAVATSIGGAEHDGGGARPTAPDDDNVNRRSRSSISPAVVIGCVGLIVLAIGAIAAAFVAAGGWSGPDADVAERREPCSDAVGLNATTVRDRLEVLDFQVMDQPVVTTRGSPGEVVDCVADGPNVILQVIETVVPADCSSVVGANGEQARTQLDEAGYTAVELSEATDLSVPPGQVVSCSVDTDLAAAALVVSTGPPEGDLTVRVGELTFAPDQDCGDEGIRPNVFGSVELAYGSETRSFDLYDQPDDGGSLPLAEEWTLVDVVAAQELLMSWELLDDDFFTVIYEEIGESGSSILLTGESTTWEPTAADDDSCRYAWTVSISWTL